MFLLRDIPTYQTLEKLSRRYKELDPSAMMTGIALLRTGSDMLVTLEKFLSPYGLSQGGYLTLIVLNRDPDEEIVPSDLAGRVGVTRATMTGLLDTLAKDGLIERIPHDGDRRQLVVRLTQKGIERLNEVLPSIYRQITEIMVGLSEKEKEELIRLLEKVKKGISKE